MRPILLLLLPITLGISPLAAQLTPEQRHDREVKDANAHLSDHLQQQWTERALNGDPSAYGGVAARQERWYLTQRLGFGDWARRMASNGVSPESQPWFAIGARPASLRSLKQPNVKEASIKAGTPNVLTLATLAGGPARTLPIRAEIRSSDPNNGWSQTSPVTADQNGRYLIQVPALAAGTYDLLFQVFDPAHPDTPLSGGQNALVVKE